MAIAEPSRKRAPQDRQPVGSRAARRGGRRPLRVLLLEDSPVDATLILDELRQGGYEPHAARVASRADMLVALHDGSSWQVVLLDYSLQDGGAARDALAALAALELDLPVILISDA